jgi:hypothetical protein
MNYFLATDSDAEVEEAEVERLVRPSPKQKPPRRDRRRERVVEDTGKESDPDLSLNYKRVGALVSAKNPNKKKVKVQITEGKNKGEITNVNVETLQSHPERYVIPKDDGTPAAWSPEEQALYDGGTDLNERAKDDPELASMIRDLLNPKGQGAGYLAESTPSFPAKSLMRGKELPKGIETLGDLVKALRQAQKTPPGQAKSKREPAPAPPPESGPSEPSEIIPSPDKTEAPKSEPESDKSDPDEPSADKPDGSDSKSPEPKTEPDKTPGNKPASKIKRRVPEEWEELSARTAVLETVPQGEIRRKLLDGLMRGHVHVDDVSEILATYHTAKRRPSSEKTAEQLIADAAGWFVTDVSQVKPPKYGKTYAGEEKPYSELTPEEQELSLTAHKNRSLALSMAAQESVKQVLTKTIETPPALASFLSLVLLKQKSEDPEYEEANSRAVAAQVYRRTLAEGTSEIVDPDTIKKTFEFIGDNSLAQRAAAAYFQARDYQEARDRFLKSDSPEHVSEHDSVEDIVRGITRGSDYLSDKSFLYPRTAITQDPAGAFRNKLLDSIRTLRPDKYPDIRERLDVYERRLYDKQKVKYDREVEKIQKRYQRSVEKSLSKHDRALEQAKSKHEADLKSYTKAYKRYDRDYKKFLDDLKEQQELAQKSGYRIAPKQLTPPVPPEPPKGLEAPLAIDLLDVPELPEPPPKPARYGLTGTMSESESVWEEQKKQVTATNKRAVYWGVEEKPKIESPVWQHAKNQDLTRADLSAIEARAKTWLKALPKEMPEDTRARAALDHGIRDADDGAYAAGVPPPQYEDLLGRMSKKGSLSELAKTDPVAAFDLLLGRK